MRFYQYLPWLASQGIQVHTAELLDNNYLRTLYCRGHRNWTVVVSSYLRRIRDLAKSVHFDLIWIEAEVLPWLPAWAEYWLSWKKIPYIVDYDDAAFHRYDLHGYRAIRWILGRKIDTVMQKATVVVAGNEYVARRAISAGASRVEVLPTVVDLRRYPVCLKPRSTTYVIGWIGSPSTAGYLTLLKNTLERLSKTDKVLLRICGAGPVHWQNVNTESVPWSEETEVQTLQAFDVGIMPLPDTPWANGKCGYKLVQYMACGLPVVASPVGANVQIVHHSVNGLLARSQDEWFEALHFLRSEPEAGASMGTAARKSIEDRYCLSVTAPRLAELLLASAR